MNYCPEYESRILEYDELTAERRVELDDHLAGCEGCRQFSCALAVVDVTLTDGLRLAGGGMSVRRCVIAPERPPLWPELLDLAGWVSLIAALVAVAAVLFPANLQEMAPWSALGLATAVGTVWFGFKSWRELDS
jgi:hypothetical protein